MKKFLFLAIFMSVLTFTNISNSFALSPARPDIGGFVCWNGQFYAYMYLCPAKPVDNHNYTCSCYCSYGYCYNNSNNYGGYGSYGGNGGYYNYNNYGYGYNNYNYQPVIDNSYSYNPYGYGNYNYSSNGYNNTSGGILSNTLGSLAGTNFTTPWNGSSNWIINSPSYYGW